jgi:hypothetical protein
MYYPSKSFSQISQNSVVGEVRRVLNKNKGAEGALRQDTLDIVQNNRTILKMKIYQPVSTGQQTISRSHQ